MFTKDRHIEESGYVSLTDYSTECPEGMKTYFAYVYFCDSSVVLFGRIFAVRRKAALAQVLERFSDCEDYISGINLHSRDE